MAINDNDGEEWLKHHDFMKLEIGPERTNKIVCVEHDLFNKFQTNINYRYDKHFAKDWQKHDFAFMM